MAVLIEIRREEDYEPLGFNFVKLGLSDDMSGNERSVSASKKFYSGGGPSGKSAKSVDKSGKSGTIEKRPKSLKIGKKERERLSHQIATDFPNLKPGQEMNYENRNHFYRFTVNGLGNYSYHLKIKIVGNEDYINSIRKKGK
jgi:hypothetical protein